MRGAADFIEDERQRVLTVNVFLSVDIAIKGVRQCSEKFSNCGHWAQAIVASEMRSFPKIQKNYFNIGVADAEKRYAFNFLSRLFR